MKMLFKSKDDIVGNYGRVRASLSDAISQQKETFGLVIDRWVEEAYNESLKALRVELSLKPSDLNNFASFDPALSVLKDNFRTINFEMWDAIEKELTIFLTTSELNGVPIRNTEFRKEIKRVFDVKAGRLQSQIMTETNRVLGATLEFGYDQSGLVVAKQWVAILDGVTTIICENGNGSIALLGEPFATGHFTNPFHINCRSSIKSLTLKEAQAQGINV